MNFMFSILGILILIDLGIVFHVSRKKSSFETFPDSNYDCGIVFYNGYKGLNEETRRRLDCCIELFRQKKINFIICSGGNRKRSSYHGSYEMRKYIIRKFSQSKKIIFVEKYSFDSITNIFFSEKIILRRNFKKVIFISDKLHLKRLMSIAKRNKDYSRAFVAYDTKNIASLKQYLLIWKSMHSELFAWAGYLIKISPIWRKLY